MSRQQRGGGADHRGPPRLASRLLAWALPADQRGRSIVGDLLEEWHLRAPGPSRSIWYWREALRISVRYLPVRRRLPGVPVRKSRGGARREGWGRRGSIRPLSFLPLDDLRYGLRRIARAPVASFLTVLALGVGIAAPTVMYSLLVGVTRPLPVPEPDDLVHVGLRYTPTIVRGADLDWLRPLLEEPSAGPGTELSSVGAFGIGQYDLSGGLGFAERRRGAVVTPGVFRTLRVEPAMGRAFDDEAAVSGDPVVVLSDLLWRERMGADPDALGTQLRIDGTPHTVIGVMPPGFAFPDDADLWLSLDLGRGAGARRSAELVGRLAEGASIEGVRERVAGVMAGLRQTGVVDPEIRGGLDAEPWADRSIDENGRRMLHVMVLLVSFVLVIACADVAHLFLARALAQRGETAVRIALGASRWHVARQHLTESALLAFFGGALGLAIDAGGVRGLAAAMAPRLGWWMDIRLDPSILIFSVGLVALAALATGLVPMLHSTRLDVAASLGESGRGRTVSRSMSRLTGGLVVGEVALTCVLLVIAGLLTRGAISFDTDGEYATTSVLTASYELHPERHATGDEVLAFHREVATRMAARPGVAAAGVVSHLPGIYSLSAPIEVDGETYERPDDRPTPHVVYASPGFLDAMAVSPARGRDLRWSDGATEPLAALVNEPFVREHLGGREPLGVRIRLGADAGASDPEPEQAWATIVGVAPRLGLGVGLSDDDTGIYLPLTASTQRSLWLVARAEQSGAGVLAPAAREIVAELDADIALSDAASLEDRIRATYDMERLFAVLFMCFGGAGLVLAGVGLYGLMAFTVGRRVKELGIRSALGAGPAIVVWSAVRSGVQQVGGGLLLGIGLAWLVAPLLGNRFLGYQAGDLSAYGAVALTLLLTGLAAAAGPARRAVSADVAEVLRAE